MTLRGPADIIAIHNAEAQCRPQHAFSITQGNSPCVASGVRHGLAHRSVGSSRNGVSAPRVAAIDLRKPRMTKSSRQLTWICNPPPPPPAQVYSKRLLLRARVRSLLQGTGLVREEHSSCLTSRYSALPKSVFFFYLCSDCFIIYYIYLRFI